MNRARSRAFRFIASADNASESAAQVMPLLFVVPADAVTVSGVLRFHAQIADDGSNVSRGFCPECGSPILGTTSGNPDIVIITAASLDDPGLFKPQKHGWSSGGQEWDFIDPGLPRD